MSEVENKEKLLLQHFHQFYMKLEELKSTAKSGSWIYSDGAKIEKKQSEDKEAISSNQVYQELISLFEKQQISAGRSGARRGLAGLS